MKKEKVIIGIDPGTTIMGYGLIYNKDKKIELITLGILKLSKYSDHPLKLQKIFERIISLIDEYKPDELAIEAPFYGKNVQSMLKLGRAQGVAMAAALSRNIPIFEYSPRKIKQSITGKGNASKEQVAAMICNLLTIKNPPDYLDATDGVAVALCHHFQQGPDTGSNKYSGWKAFLKDNPGRQI